MGGTPLPPRSNRIMQLPGIRDAGERLNFIIFSIVLRFFRPHLTYGFFFVFFPSPSKIFRRAADHGLSRIHSRRPPLLYFPPPLCFSARFRDVAHSQRVPRLAKEQRLYAQENQDQKLKLDKLVANSPDEWETKNGVRHYCLPSTPLDRRVSMSAWPTLRTCGPSLVLI